MIRRFTWTAIASVVLAGCSGGSTVPRSTAVTVPVGWKQVSYQTVQIDVPSSWVVEPWRANCGVSVPTVFLGPQQPSVLFCPAFVPGGAEVILGALPYTGTGLHPHTETIHGLKAYEYTTADVYDGHLNGTITKIWVNLPAEDINISVAVGESTDFPGGAPGRAEQIVESIHRVDYFPT